MSIYATLWQIRLPLRDWSVLFTNQHGTFRLEKDRLLPYEETWVEIIGQAVPGHIGHPDEYPDGDPYASFLPPPVDDPEKYRAVVLIRGDRNRKEGQRYVEALMTLSWDEYKTWPFDGLLNKIYEAIENGPEADTNSNRSR